MMTVREFALGAINPEEMSVLVGGESYDLVSEDSGKINSRLLDMLGDYIIEDYKANEPDRYSVWVLMKPVKKGEV